MPASTPCGGRRPWLLVTLLPCIIADSPDCRHARPRAPRRRHVSRCASLKTAAISLLKRRRPNDLVTTNAVGLGQVEPGRICSRRARALNLEASLGSARAIPRARGGAVGPACQCKHGLTDREAVRERSGQRRVSHDCVRALIAGRRHPPSRGHAAVMRHAPGVPDVSVLLTSHPGEFSCPVVAPGGAPSPPL